MEKKIRWPITACGWSTSRCKRRSEHLAKKHRTRDGKAALQTQNRAAAKQGLEETANELERMTALSENLSKNQKRTT